MMRRLAAVGIFLVLMSVQSSKEDSRVYVAVMSDRGQFAGLVGTVSSIVKSSQQIQRLRLVIIVPYQEARAVDHAFICLASGGNSHQGRGETGFFKKRYQQQPTKGRQLLWQDRYRNRNESSIITNTTEGESETVGKRKRPRGFVASSPWRQLSSRGGSFVVVGFIAFKHRHEQVNSRENQRLTSPFNYARLYLASLPTRLVPASVEKLVYLDADVNVKVDLTRLADGVSFEPEQLVATVPRHERHICKTLLKCNREGVRQAFMEKNITDPEMNLTDFNAGVLVLRLSHWRDSRTDPLPEMEYWIRMNRDLNFFSLGTNPPLVLTLRSQHQQALDPSWNCQDYDRSKKKSLASNSSCIPHAKILHYSGANKPWFLPANESLFQLGWALPKEAHACSEKLKKLGVRARREKRAPFDFEGPGIPQSILKEHIAAGDIPRLRNKRIPQLLGRSHSLPRRSSSSNQQIQQPQRRRYRTRGGSGVVVGRGVRPSLGPTKDFGE